MPTEADHPRSHEGDSLHQILDEIRANDNFLMPKSHNMLVYDTLKSFERFYCEYAAKCLPRNEIILIATQYQTFDMVDRALSKFGIDVTKHMDEGTLNIMDAQEGYMLGDVCSAFKLAMSLVRRAEKHGRHGLTWIGDMGSFIGFQKVNDLIEYELSCPQRYENEMIRTICCYHEGDFRRLSTENQDILLKHHFRSLTIR